MRSSSSATKRRADSPPPTEQLMARLSTEKRMAGEPPLAKQVKDDDPLPPVCALYNIEQWLLAESMELPCLAKKDHKGKQRVDSGLPPKTGDSSCPTTNLPTRKAAKPHPVALLPISVTGVLPRPLGKTAVLPAVCTRQWFDDCPLDDPRFIELAEQAPMVPFREHTLVHHVTNKHKRQHRKHEAM